MIRPEAYLADESKRQMAQREVAVPIFGPYEEERHAYEDALPFAVDNSRDRRRQMAEWLRAVCRAAGVELGDYDEEVVRLLSRSEPQVIQSIVGMISRAGAR